MLAIAIAIRLTSPGPALYWSDRIGRRNTIFSMPKFRSMRTDTPQVATHLLAGLAEASSPRLANYSGRPASMNCLNSGACSKAICRWLARGRLCSTRTIWSNCAQAVGSVNFSRESPGWAQVNGRDELSIPVKVEFDAEYVARRSFWFDVKIIALTVLKVIKSDGIRQADDPVQSTDDTIQRTDDGRSTD